jgi:hypothetical protein
VSCLINGDVYETHKTYVCCRHMCAAVSFINIIISSGALAQGRPLTTAMACNQAQRLVATQGSVVLNTSATAYE